MLQRNVNLQPFNTLNVQVTADFFVQVSSVADLLSALKEKQVVCPDVPTLVLGGGSNLVLTGDYAGLVILNGMLGIELVEETDDQVRVRIGAGENWDDFVAYALARGWYGLENLSAIPGTVGAAPIQNIGAYGVELKDHFYSLEYWDLDNPTSDAGLHTLLKNQCEFGYRDSVFKTRLRNRTVICSVTLQLSKRPDLKLGYGDVLSSMQAKNLTADTITAQQLREVITEIRWAKLPKPNELPNVGSFFKNPVVSEQLYTQIKKQYPDVVAYDVGAGEFKLAAGWLIDRLGWKGRQKGAAAVHDKQALVLVNGGERPDDLLALAQEIQAAVKDAFGVGLEPEPNII